MTTASSSAPLPAGATVRFRVADHHGRSGSSWSVKTAKVGGDVYVTHRDGGRWVHMSLHRDGRWHFAVTPAGQELVPDAPAYLGVTRDHVSVAPGWLHALRITVAADQLRDGWSERVTSRQVAEVPMHESADALSIDFLLGAPAAHALRIDDAYLVANMIRGDGGSAAIVARPAHLDEPVAQIFAAQIAQAERELRQSGWDGAANTRIVIFGDDEAGYLRQVEVAIDPDV